MTVLLSLFLSFVQVGSFSVGGGYAAIPLIQAQVCEIHPWLALNEFSHLVTIAEMTPGPIAINAATFVGARIAGLPGAVVATFGCILPSCLIVTLLSFLYRKCRSLSAMHSALAALRPVVVALIAGAGLSLLRAALWADAVTLAQTDALQLILFLLAFFLLKKYRCNPILMMLLCGLCYLCITLPL